MSPIAELSATYNQIILAVDARYGPGEVQAIFTMYLTER